MPEYFAIKRVENNPLWKKYIDWLKVTYGEYWKDDRNASYYGYDGNALFRGTNVFDNITEFKNNPVELTLSQWNQIINKNIKEEFKLPEKWCVQDSEQVSKWANETIMGCNPSVRYHRKLCIDQRLFPKYECFYFYDSEDVKNYTEITTEQFVKYVLKQEVMEAKEIVGYKLKEDCKKYSKAAFNICTGYTNERGILGEVSSKNDIRKLKEVGVLELWFEPVYKDKTPDITINGYKGEFFDTYVKFGCAEIDRDLFLDLNGIIYESGVAEDTKGYDYPKQIESVTIDKGTFTKDQIKEIAEYYNER